MGSLRLMFGIGILAGSAALTACNGAGSIFGHDDDGGAGTGGTAGAAGTAGTGGGGNAGGSDGGEAGTCDASGQPNQNPCAVDNQYGVFIDATGGSDDTGDGTQEHPYQTFAKGVEKATAGGKRLFACAGTYAESVKLTAANNGIEMFGGFACSDWSYTGDKTEVAPGTNGPALAIDTVDKAHVEDIAFTSSDAATPGDDSIAASVNKSKKVELVGVTLTAGKGADGLAGTKFTKAATTGKDGNKGADACAGNPAPGGAAASTVCGSLTSVGGKGGDGGVGAGNAGAGDNGLPDLGMGHAGYGQADANWSCAASGTNGGGRIGADGSNGAAGAGATGLGTLDASGVTGVPGSAGTAGTPGQGGGGGGGAQAQSSAKGLLCGVLGANTGAAGGSGGGGGCGGEGGPGGGAGGSSIALVSIDSDILLQNSALVADQGGDGGEGALGQTGGDGGQPGAGGGRGSTQWHPGCAGGAGGLGGNGGNGGGGAGGHSIAIAYTGTSPLLDSNTTMSESTTPATGGLGGGGSATNQGDDGITKDLQSF